MGDITTDDTTLWIAWTARGNPLKVNGRRLYGTKSDWAKYPHMRAAEFEAFDVTGKNPKNISPLWEWAAGTNADPPGPLGTAHTQLVKLGGRLVDAQLVDVDQIEWIDYGD